VGEKNTEPGIDAVHLGAFDYLTKPLNQSYTKVAVERALRHRTLLKEMRGYKEQLEFLLAERTAELDRLAYYDPNHSVAESDTL
jgi:DNA-binding NtrC family response regulator